jgi:nicotinate-nucleotide adenylyltransferase
MNEKMTGKICIFGGTFNPPHIAHKHMAEKVLEEFGFDRIIFMPTGNSYLKKHVLAASERLKMVTLFCDTNPLFDVSDFEVKSEGPTYTYRTLSSLRDENPGAEFYFLLGEDSLRYMENWIHPEIIFECASIIAVRRDDQESYINKDDKRSFEDVAWNLKDKFDARIFSVTFNEDISSSKIREAFKSGNGDSVVNMLTKEVYDYIIKEHLYV